MRVVRDVWPTVAICLVLGMTVGWVVSIATPKVYRADVQLFVAHKHDIVLLPVRNTFVQAQTQALTTYANSPQVTSDVISELDLPLTPGQLANKISADAPSNKVLINVHVTDANPAESAKLANAVAVAFATTVRLGSTDIQISVMHPATTPTTPIRPNRTLDIWLGSLIGLVIGLILVVLRRFASPPVGGRRSGGL